MRRAIGLLGAILALSLIPLSAIADQWVGTVKSTDSKKQTFVLSTSRGTYQVDAVRARVRDHGKFAHWGTIRAGSKVEVQGTLKAGTITAQDVNVNPADDSGAKKAARTKPELAPGTSESVGKRRVKDPGEKSATEKKRKDSKADEKTLVEKKRRKDAKSDEKSLTEPKKRKDSKSDEKTLVEKKRKKDAKSAEKAVTEPKKRIKETKGDKAKAEEPKKRKSKKDSKSDSTGEPKKKKSPPGEEKP